MPRLLMTVVPLGEMSVSGLTHPERFDVLTASKVGPPWTADDGFKSMVLLAEKRNRYSATASQNHMAMHSEHEPPLQSRL